MAGSDVEKVRREVRAHYAAAAVGGGATGGTSDSRGPRRGGSCCEEAAGCGPGFYPAVDRAGMPRGAAVASLGCGNPTAVADLRAGEVVLDLGSGGGLDVLLSARRVGPAGRVIGLDMTDEMLDLARRNAAEAGMTNVEFLRGHIEDIPLPDASVDVVISNCVVNLSPDKPAVFAEVHRVLRPGGRLALADVIARDGLSPAERAGRGSWAACVAGALSAEEYRCGLEAAGFGGVAVEVTHEAGDGFHGAIVRAVKPATGQVVATVDAARVEDVGAIRALLADVGLPTVGLGEHVDGLLVARRGDKVVGSAGVERYGEAALLRSVAVARGERGVGLGARLVRHAVAAAARCGAEEVWLLTATAGEWFARRGFEAAAREDMPAVIAARAELWRGACPDTAAVYVLRRV